MFISMTNLITTRSANNSTAVLYKVKVKFSLERAMKAQMGSRGIALLFLALDEGGWSNPRPGCLTPGK
jgi:hypothetical protein